MEGEDKSQKMTTRAQPEHPGTAGVQTQAQLPAGEGSGDSFTKTVASVKVRASSNTWT